MKVTVFDDYQDAVRTLDCFKLLDGHDVTIWTDYSADLDVLGRRLADTEALVLLRERTPVTAALLDRAPKLKLISQNGHVPHIDLSACTAHGVVVSSALTARPSYPTAELTWGLIIAAMRHLPFEIAAMKQGRWQSTIGLGLRGRTLGIYGYGRIGTFVANYAKAFEMNILVWGREGSRERAAKDGLPIAASKADLFERSDALTVHLRLNDQTRGIITAEDLAHMKPSAVIVNTSRGELIAAGALEEALRQGRPGMAAIDVFANEPVMDANHPLLQLPNAICTPHLGYVERDNHEFAFGNAFRQILAFVDGKPINVHNDDVLKTMAH